ncbi:anti-CBASS protein Acb1 family protein, partial [Borrelia persica]|uniref:anti-CBASS protein Acb1 family protein n=1 Tax=Borrelia persica TaxID=44448 RepID=UPI0004632954
KEVKIHKSRLIIYENYDYILGSYTPCYTQGFLLNIYLFEIIYQEIEKRIRNYNFLFYKDESLAEINDAISKASLQINLLTKSNKDNNPSMFKKLFKGNSDNDSVSKSTNILNALNNDLSRELERLKSNLNNDGIFYSGSQTAHLEVIKYELTFLKDALELVKAKIGADTKEPLTRSFNEQTKGLGSDGKGDRSNYYDFLKGVQEQIEITINQKLNQYFGLNMRFNSLILLSESEKIERDIKLLELYEKYKSVIGCEGLSQESIELLKDKLYFGEIFLGG